MDFGPGRLGRCPNLQIDAPSGARFPISLRPHEFPPIALLLLLLRLCCRVNDSGVYGAVNITECALLWVHVMVVALPFLSQQATHGNDESQVIIKKSVNCNNCVEYALRYRWFDFGSGNSCPATQSAHRDN